MSAFGAKADIPFDRNQIVENISTPALAPKGPDISALTRCTVPEPTPQSSATLRMILDSFFERRLDLGSAPIALPLLVPVSAARRVADAIKHLKTKSEKAW